MNSSAVSFDSENILLAVRQQAAGCGPCSYLKLLHRDQSLCDDFLRILVQDTLLLLDLLVHQRLREHRLVHLVVTHPAVTHLHSHTHTHRVKQAAAKCLHYGGGGDRGRSERKEGKGGGRADETDEGKRQEEKGKRGKEKETEEMIGSDTRERKRKEGG